MTPPSTGEVMEALERMLRAARCDVQLARRDLANGRRNAESEYAAAEADLRALALFEQYAPEICSRAEKEAKGIREVRVVLTVQEAGALLKNRPWEDSYWSASCKLESAIRDLDEPASLVEAKKEENSE